MTTQALYHLRSSLESAIETCQQSPAYAQARFVYEALIPVVDAAIKAAQEQTQ